ncbi:MAG: DUF1080 domain-containing protein [Phycisphaeraceae bacterium]|nr:DUF1080 domain-containing protein [Phycisphaeraceae bacterium]
MCTRSSRADARGRGLHGLPLHAFVTLLLTSHAVGIAAASSVAAGSEQVLPAGGAGTAAGGDWLDLNSLEHWVVVNGTSTTWRQEGDELISTGVPYGMLRTRRPFTNFILELEWKHIDPRGNAGIFIWGDPIPAKGVPFPRSIEVQVMLTDDVHDEQGRLLYTGQGDIFSIHGARCTPVNPHPAGWQRALPAARHTKGAGEWNHYRIEARDGTITLSVNGHQVSEVRDGNPRSGFLSLEPEGSEIRFRNIRLKELPVGESSEEGSPSLAMRGGDGWKTLFGADLAPWKLDTELAKHWSVHGTTLRFDGRGGDLWTRESFGDFDLVVDWRWTKEHQGLMHRPVILPDGSEATHEDGSVKTVEVEERDSGIFLRGSTKAQVNMWMWPVGSGEIYGYRVDPASSAELRAACTPNHPADAPVGQWNRFEISVRGSSVTVHLNGTLVIDGAELPGLPPRGPIGLQSHGSPVEFMNIFVRPYP